MTARKDFHLSTRDVHSLTDFLRNHKRHVAELKESGRPEVLTINGKAELIVQDAESYQQLLDRLAEAEFVTAVNEGIADYKAGRTMDLDEAFDSVKEELGLQD